MKTMCCSLRRAALGLLAAIGLFAASMGAQDRLKTMPGYEQYQRLGKEISGAVKPGTLSVTWKDATAFEYVKDNKIFRYDIAEEGGRRDRPRARSAGWRAARGPRTRRRGPGTRPTGRLRPFP